MPSHPWGRSVPGGIGSSRGISDIRATSGHRVGKSEKLRKFRKNSEKIFFYPFIFSSFIWMILESKCPKFRMYQLHSNICYCGVVALFSCRPMALFTNQCQMESAACQNIGSVRIPRRKGKTGFHYSLPALEEKGLREDIPPSRLASGSCLLQVQLVPELRSELAERRLKPTAGSVYHFSST